MDIADDLGLFDLRCPGVKQPGLGIMRIGYLEHGRFFQRIHREAVRIAGGKGITHDLIVERGSFKKEIP